MDLSAIRLELDETADPRFQRVATDYWAFDGADDNGEPIWVNQASELGAKDLGGRPNVVAAAGGALIVAGTACPGCGREPFLPTSRAAFAALRRGGSAQPCRGCSISLAEELERFADPHRRAKRSQRAAAAAQMQHRNLTREAEAQALELARRHTIRAAHPLQEWQQKPSDIKERLYLELACRYASSPVGIGPISDIDPPLSGTPVQMLELLREADLLRISPDSTVNSIPWAEGSAEDPHAYYPLRAIYQLPGKGQHQQRLERILDELPPLTLESMTRAERLQLREIILDTMLDEAIRYLDLQLELHRLPALDTGHAQQLDSSLRSRARSLSIGQLYAIAFSAARSAASAKQQHPMRALSATQRAVNAFERGVDDALTRDYYQEPYRLDSRLPLTRLASRVYRLILGVDPLTTSLEDAELLLELARDCPEPPDWYEQCSRLFTGAGTWTPDRLAGALLDIAEDDDHEHASCPPACPWRKVHETADQLLTLNARLRQTGVDDEARALLVLQATSVAGVHDHGAAVLALIASRLQLPTLRAVD